MYMDPARMRIVCVITTVSKVSDQRCVVSSMRRSGLVVRLPTSTFVKLAMVKLGTRIRVKCGDLVGPGPPPKLSQSMSNYRSQIGTGPCTGTRLQKSAIRSPSETHS